MEVHGATHKPGVPSVGGVHLQVRPRGCMTPGNCSPTFPVRASPMSVDHLLVWARPECECATRILHTVGLDSTGDSEMRDGP